MKKVMFLSFILVLWMRSVEAQTVPLQNALLWKISGNDIQADSYIYLTSQTCNEKIVWKPAVSNAISNAKTIAVEFNFSGKTALQKIRSNFTVANDSQRIKNVFTNAQYLEFAKYYKDQGATNEDMDRFNNINISMLYMMRMSELTPCDRSLKLEKPEDALHAVSDKDAKAYVELLSVDEVLTEYNLHPTHFWQQNMWYAFKNEDQLKQTVQRKIDLYNAEDLNGLRDLYKSDPQLKLQESDGVLNNHIQNLEAKIEELLKTGPAIIQVSVNNVVFPGVSLFELLEKKGFKLTPVLN